jgi:16S rRNA (cytosine967-C5)-methyltransferase
MAVSSARAAAFDILLRVEREDAYATELLHSSRYADFTPADHNLATELVMGVLRWRSALDATLAPASSKPLQTLDPEVLIALRLGAYQLGWLDRVPAHAAIHESVELVKRARKRSAAPFANAVLRKLSAKPRPHAGTDSILAATAPEVLAASSAHPEWLVSRWISQFGLATARIMCAFDQVIPTTTVRLRDTTVEATLVERHIGLAPGELLASARRVIRGDITRTSELAMQRFAIQDEASQLVAALVGRGQRILDACAAPGGKTWSIADRNPHAMVTAVELHSHRAELLRKRVPCANVAVVHGDLRDVPLGEPFDRVLVDSPCSGTGTLARNPEIKWRLRPEDLCDLQSRQLAILQAAMHHVGRDGRLIYATCSMEREENELVIERVLAAEPAFHVIDCSLELERLRREGELIASVDALLSGPYLRTVPGIQHSDGFFAAILQRV